MTSTSESTPSINGASLSAGGNSTLDVDSLKTSFFPEEYSGEADLTELLNLDTINASEDMAKAVEARLDGILGNLDVLLASLEEERPTAVQSKAQTGSNNS